MQDALHMGLAFPQTKDANRFLSLTALANEPSQALASQSQIAEILKATPDYVPALMAQATIAQHKNEADAAQQTYQDILKIYPDFAPAQKQLAILYAKNPDNDAMAYPLAMKAYQAFPQDAETAKTLGMIVCRQGDYARAINLLQAAEAQSNQDPQLLYYLGLAQYHLNQSQQSKATLRRALALDLSGQDATEAKLILAELR
jgi:tetratricopeptide (TPR) repeat protein